MHSKPLSPESREHATQTILRTLRAYGDAHDRMSSGMKDDMGMNLNDLATLRMLIIRAQNGQLVTLADIARHLRISTASTTVLINRLCKSGHVQRLPHPTDRRAVIVTLTEKASEDFYKNFSHRLKAMRENLQPFTTEELTTANKVLKALTTAVNES